MTEVIKVVLPAKKRIISSQISENSFDDNLIISILSSGTLKDGNKDKGALTAYKYNLKSGDLDQITYALNRDDILTGKANDLQSLYETKVEFLADGSALFQLIGEFHSGAYQNRSIVLLKADKNGEFQ